MRAPWRSSISSSGYMRAASAWAKLKPSGSALAENGCAPATRALLAKRIIETAQKGERDANRLVEDGLAYLSELK
jgi:hypothetical protein